MNEKVYHRFSPLDSGLAGQPEIFDIEYIWTAKYNQKKFIKLI